MQLPISPLPIKMCQEPCVYAAPSLKKLGRGAEPQPSFKIMDPSHSCSPSWWWAPILMRNVEVTLTPVSSSSSHPFLPHSTVSALSVYIWSFSALCPTRLPFSSTSFQAPHGDYHKSSRSQFFPPTGPREIIQSEHLNSSLSASTPSITRKFLLYSG